MTQMTFSIVAHCPQTGEFGVAAATEMVGVGKLLTHARQMPKRAHVYRHTRGD
jgi:uncharacterized Ntn-hydrolase superfamily protein